MWNFLVFFYVYNIGYWKTKFTSKHLFDIGEIEADELAFRIVISVRLFRPLLLGSSSEF